MDDIPSDSTVRVSMQLTLNHPIKIFSVVPGGFHPPWVAHAFMHVLDRNVVSRLAALRAPPNAHSSDAIEANLAMYNRSGVTLNPVFCAAESDVMAPPDARTFFDNLALTDQVLRTRLPRATTVRWSIADVQPVYDTFANLHPRTKREMEILIQLAPALLTIKRGQRGALVDQLAIAMNNTPKPSPVFVYTVLSLIYGGKYARGVLKPKLAVDPAGAYNALADLRHFEFFLLGAALDLRPSLAFTTMDKSLAQLAIGMRVEQLSLVEHDGVAHFGFKGSLGTEHFPQLPAVDLDKIRALVGT